MTRSPPHSSPERVLAIDPGTTKCGLALVSAEGRPLALRIVSVEELGATIRELAEGLPFDLVLIGDRTGSKSAEQSVAQAMPDAQIVLVPEHLTSLRARERYFRDHPPRGWRRLLPKGLRVPPVPHDDYVALVLAEDYLSGTQET